MRLAGWLRLAAISLIAVSTQAPGSSVTAGPVPSRRNLPFRRTSPVTAKPTRKPRSTRSRRVVSGWKSTPISAVRRTPQYLRVHNMIRPEGEPSEKVFESAGPMKVVKMKLTVSTEQAREIRKQAQVQAQQQRMKSHQWVSLLALIGVVCLLGRGGRLPASGGGDEGLLHAPAAYRGHWHLHRYRPGIVRHGLSLPLADGRVDH